MKRSRNGGKLIFFNFIATFKNYHNFNKRLKDRKIQKTLKTGYSDNDKN